jgi:hypothetical protein
MLRARAEAAGVRGGEEERQAVRAPAGDATMKTIQQYIDETPAWMDGTPAPGPPMTRMQ